MLVYTANTVAICLVSGLSVCVFPFICPDLLKMSLALLLAKRLAPHLPFLRENPKAVTA